MFDTPNIKKTVYGLLLLFAVLYFLSAFLAPVDHATLMKYNVSVFQLRLLTVAILLPVVAIWACAAYGFVHFKQYALSIKGSPAGKGTNTLANGLGLIALQLLMSAAVSIVTSVPDVKTAVGGVRGVTIISTGSTIVLALAASLVLYNAVSQLNASLSKRSRPKNTAASFYVVLAISVAFLAAIIHGYYAKGTTQTIYNYLPLSAAVIGIWMPYLVVWSFFWLAANHLLNYQHHVKGLVYKKTLGLLIMGIYLILGSSVFIQILGTFNGAFSSVGLLPLIIIIYVLLLAIALGYLTIARAATKLRQIEI